MGPAARRLSNHAGGDFTLSQRGVLDHYRSGRLEGSVMAKEPASIRYKNPGAMWGNNAIAKKWGAIKTVGLNDGLGQGNNIAVFPTFIQGICAQLDLWRTSKNYRNKKFADAIRTWSGGNYVESYIRFVLDRV